LKQISFLMAECNSSEGIQTFGDVLITARKKIQMDLFSFHSVMSNFAHPTIKSYIHIIFYDVWTQF